MFLKSSILCWVVLINFVAGLRINFTSCQNSEWTCLNHLPNDIVYTCSARDNEHIIHLKDFYTDNLNSVTVQNCKSLRVVLDCPILQRTSRLQQFAIRNCDNLEFITLTNLSPTQTPPTLTIDNVKHITSLPKGLFKSPTNNNERKCTGRSQLKGIFVRNSQIDVVNTKAIHNVNGVKTIEFSNVTINDVQDQAVEAILGEGNVAFTITNSRIEKLTRNSVTVQAKIVTISANLFAQIPPNVLNITSDYLHLTENAFGEISSNGLTIKSENTDITNNHIRLLKSDALSSVKCTRKTTSRKHFNFIRNIIDNVEPNSLTIDHSSCKSIRTHILFRDNKIDCKCRNIAFLSTVQNEFHNLILNAQSNNTCLSAPCILPVEVIKILKENDMCQLNLDPQVMCLLYYDKHETTNKEATSEDVTEPTATFYLIKQAKSPSAGMTAVEKDDLIRDSHKSMSNRTTVKIVFDSSKDFEETLRGTSNSRKRVKADAPAPLEGTRTQCVGAQCRSVAYDKQKALDFYKYVYAQLRPPKKT